MIKWFAYIVVLLIFAPCLSSAKLNNSFIFVADRMVITSPFKKLFVDTVTTKNSKKQDQEEKKKIKELAQAKKQPKPEKLEPAGSTTGSKPRPRRQRRPEGLERPPEIPRRSGN